ncbi:MAG: myo-inositol 2-dehydrogenase/D-chiro-inositol 1-dehydrogenase [Chlamydiales bacterium]|jgi:myo-inositol 2-dehydrogenase/D-chiro-inositol 1-dehydrogenase
MINLSLIGAGKIGSIHAEHVAENPRAQLKYIVDPNLEAASRLASRFGGKASDNVMDALSDPDVHGVIIASSTDTHANLIKRAAKNGKAVFCEKPIDLNVDQVDDCIKELEISGTPCLVGFNRRFDPNFQNVYQSIQEGKVGKVEFVRITSRDPQPPPIDYVKTSGGLFRDMAIHDFDMACWLLGEDPIEVYATASCLVDPAIAEAGDVDTALITIKSASGSLCQITNSRRASCGYDQRIEILGSKGDLKSDERLAVTPFEAKGEIPFFIRRYKESYKIEMEHFLDIIRKGTKPLVSAECGRRALVLAEAAQMSFITKTTVPLTTISSISLM